MSVNEATGLPSVQANNQTNEQDELTEQDRVFDTLTDEEKAAVAGELDDELIEDASLLAEIVKETEVPNEADAKTEAVVANKENEADAVNAETASVAQTENQALASQDTQTKAVQLQVNADDFGAKLQANKTQKAALSRQFREGEIEADDFEEKLEALQDERETLIAQRTKAEMAQEFNAQSSEKVWVETLKRFAVDVKKDGIDYAVDIEKQEDFDAVFFSLRNRVGNEKASDESLLYIAHQKVLAMHGLSKATAKAVEKTPVETVKNTVRTPPAVPKTLAHVAGSTEASDLSGEFAHLDNLKGLALEEAIARMSPSMRERFAAGE